MLLREAIGLIETLFLSCGCFMGIVLIECDKVFMDKMKYIVIG